MKKLKSVLLLMGIVIFVLVLIVCGGIEDKVSIEKIEIVKVEMKKKVN